MKNDNTENELKKMREELDQLKKKSWFQKFKEKSRFAQGVMIGLSMTAFVAIAGQITKTYTFSPGGTVFSAEVNGNFDDLFAKVNDMNLGALVKLTSNFSVTCSVSSGTNYVVPFDSIAEGDGNFDALTNYTYTIPVTGAYIVGVKPSYIMYHTVYLDIDGVDSATDLNSLTVKVLNAGQVLSVRAACDSSMLGTGQINQADAFFYIKKAL